MGRIRRIAALSGIGCVVWLNGLFAHTAIAQDKADPARDKQAATTAEKKEAAQDKQATDQATKDREEALRLERAKRAAIRGLNDKAEAGNQPARIQNAKPAAHPRQAVPKPTVVLKPGEMPGIKFDTMIYDFGRIRAGSDVIHEYWFTNTGNGPLEILSVKPS